MGGLGVAGVRRMRDKDMEVSILDIFICLIARISLKKEEKETKNH